MRVKLSVAIIVKNEPQLEQGLLSIRDHVEEIVIVDTGSTDGITQDIARKYADKFEIYTDANNPENGLIEDFARARQHSFDLASYSTVLWMDGDDILVGAEHLGEIIEEWNSSPHGLDGGQYMFPYEYAYDEQGRCTLKHYRERLIFNKDCFRWTNAVHEVIISREGFKTSIITRDDIIWKHQRQFSSKAMEPGRNLRILRKYYEKVGDSDARQLYYLGLECYNGGLIDESIGFLVKYIDLSGWEDERVMACLKLVEIYELTNNLEEGLRWAFKAVQIKETWAEGYFAAAKMCYLQACQGGPNKFRNYERCAYFAKLGLKLPPTKTLLFINPLERELEVHKYLNMAMNEIGNVPEALDSVKMGLEKHPTDPWLVNNKKLYEDFLSRNEIVKNINILKDNGTLDQLKVDQVQAIINNQPIPHLPILTAFKRSDALDIVFFAGDGVEIWTPETIKRTGIGGSELQLFQQAKKLFELGHKIRVYNSCGVGNVYDGVSYRPTAEYHDLECDVLIVSRRADMLGDQFNITAKLKLLWVHDVCAINATNELCLKADRILALSDWHRQNIITVHNVHPQHVIKTRNGIDLTRFNKSIPRNQFKCVNSSSPDRSWPILLTVWSEIKKQVPQAELHLYYGFKNWEFSAQYDKLQMDLINRLKQQIADMRSLDVIYHDRVNQEQLAEEFLGAGVWLFPTWYSETSCISAMEIQAAGVRMITSNLAALKETAGDRSVLIDGEWTSPEYQSKFIQSALKALTDNDNSDRLELQKYAQQHFELNDLAKEWEEMFYQLIEEKKTNPILPYFPTTAYQVGGKGYYDGDPRFGNHNKLQVG